MSVARREVYPLGWRRVAWLALLLPACTDGADPKDPPSAPTETCPQAPTGTIPAGDANGDGRADLADAVVILRSAAEGGAAPVCTQAVDLVPDERVELDDAFALLLHLYEGGFSLPDAVTCGSATPLPTPACSPVAARFADDGTVELRAESVSLEAWSLAVTAEGCTVTGATTAGTAAATVVDTPPGLRDLGYDATFVADGGAASAVVLGFTEALALPAGTWSPVLALTLDGGCLCTLRLDAPVTAIGEPVESLAVAGGAAWPLVAEATIDLCGGGP